MTRSLAEAWHDLLAKTKEVKHDHLRRIWAEFEERFNSMSMEGRLAALVVCGMGG